MRALTAQPTDVSPLGYFRIFAQPPGGVRREITIFRDAPIVVENCSFQDPFSEQTAQISLPQVTIFESPGEGDLDWMVPNSNIDIVWENTGRLDLDWRWEGFIASYNFGFSGTANSASIDLKGAFYGLDDYLAIPSFPKRPIPYEILIAQAFDQQRHPSSLGQFAMSFPEGWNVVVPTFSEAGYASYLKPWGVVPGQRWTGFTSRSTGSWEPLLTGHVQSLLSVMFAEGGSQWTIRNRGFRRPELRLRMIPDPEDSQIIEINLGAPGVEISGSKDWTQRADVLYGSGQDEAGVSFSGLTVSGDGAKTTYRPFAYSPLVWPRTNNPSYNPHLKPKEAQIKFQIGVDQISAAKIAQGQYQRFAEPGITGSLTLTTDPRLANGQLCPRLLIKAGTTFRLNNLFGIREGILVHATQVTVNFSNLTTTITFDSKYRDQLTVEEVMARTRDALTPLRSLQVGKYSNTVQDLILPWSYKEGSGCIPMESKEFFLNKIPDSATFPWEEWTKKHPPSNPAYKSYYLRIGPTDPEDSSNNWAVDSRTGATKMPFPIRMGHSGTIRLTQVAAYDKDGNVKPVRFHVSFYSAQGTAVDQLPSFPTAPTTGSPKFLAPAGITTNYKDHQANPFFEGAWEKTKPDGYQLGEMEQQWMVPSDSAELVVGWGNYYEPAGYSPGRFSKGASRTGLLEDDTQWSWDVSKYLNANDPTFNQNVEYAGMLFIHIYCDEQGTDPVYFMGKLTRVDPGTS